MLKQKVAHKTIAHKIVTLLGLITWGIIIADSLFLAGKAQSENQPNAIAEEASYQSIESVNNFEPPERGAPSRTADGGSRGCGQMTLLIPADQGATTISENPTLFWYLNPTPDAPTKYRPINKLAVVLINDQEEEVYTEMIDAPSQASIISFQLPKSQSPVLEAGKWYNILIGAYNQENPNIYEPCSSLSAWIKRQVLTNEQQQQLNIVSSDEERLQFYIQHEIWYDALATLAELIGQNPHNSTQNNQWIQMLESIELGGLANQPLLKPTQIVSNIDQTSNP